MNENILDNELENMEEERVTLVDDTDGQTYDLVIIARLEIEGRNYVAMIPDYPEEEEETEQVDEDDEEGEPETLWLAETVEVDGEYSMRLIEEDEEYDEIVVHFVEILQEEYSFEDEE